MASVCLKVSTNYFRVCVNYIDFSLIRLLDPLYSLCFSRHGFQASVFLIFSSSGYEKYNSMRADPALCFLERVGMPDAKAIAAEQRGSDMMADGVEG